ncbi:uncharacterized protein [Misgurnus anguillicaudatus]|uniref:uncharacterized protein isoform X1 n=2 Tax=Misgurnus anguillicaudatus TaxID=75329 RepID=UPI003CCF3074
MAFLLSVILVILLEIKGTSCLWTVSKITAKTGGSVTIPCNYHLNNKEQPKYWCKGRNWSTCMTLRPTNQKEKRPGISFHNDPDELVMTMTMTNLRTSDSNRYWCAVKIGGLLRSDMKTSLDLTVTEGIPDLSVASNMVSSEEGGNITVECIYSEKLKSSEKKWCLSRLLHSCQTARDLKSSAVQINDTNDGVYQVTMTGLKKTDAGWYWCMAGGLQAPVHINVTSVQFNATNTGPSTSTTIPWSSYTPTKSFTINPLTFANVNSHNSGATSKLPESSSDENEKISTTSPKQLPTTIDSSTYPTTINKNSSHFSGVTTLLTSGSETVGSNSPVTVSSKDHKSPFECRDLVCVIMLVCGALLLIFIISGIWTMWSWQRKANKGEDATEITTELLYMKANDKDDL